MLKVATIEDSSQNLIAPSVYIEGVEKENGSYTIHYSLTDTNNSWITNPDVLNRLSVYISDGTITEKRLLLASTTTNVIKNNTIKDYFIIKNTGSAVSMSAWVGDQYISGAKTIEQIQLNNTITKATYNSTTYEYINKIKDFNILNFNVLLNGSIANTNTTPLESDLLIAYRPNKIANLGFVLNLEKLLEQKSPLFNVLKNKTEYRNIILNNSKINIEKSYFSKKNLTKKEKDYTKINNNVFSTILSATTGNYFVGVVDDNKDINNRSYYDIKCYLEIDDYSSRFIGEKIQTDLAAALKLLEAYTLDFTNASQDKTIGDANIYIFENLYESKLPEITNFVNNLSPLCSLFSGKDAQQFVSLFVSCLHPLTTNVSILNRLTVFVNKLRSVVEQLSVSTINADNATKSITKNTIIYERQFGKSEENINAADMNYDYDANTGLEVLALDSLTVRNAEPPTAIKEINSNDLNARKILESTKYFKNPYSSTSAKINLYSVASFDLNGESLQTLAGLPQTSTDVYNEFYIKLKEYNDFTFSYRKPETYFFQLAGEGINIKTVSNRDNKSINNLQKNTLFDSNSDTKQSSLKFVSDTNIKALYYALDSESFVALTNISSSEQYRAAVSDGTGETPVFAYNQQSLNNSDLKAKTYVYYNNFYSFNPIAGVDNTNIDIYTIKEECVAPIFNKKLRLFNSFFGVRKTNISATVPEIIYNIQNDIKLNIPSIYLSRTTTAGSVNISTADI
jgi:hypothetical protein